MVVHRFLSLRKGEAIKSTVSLRVGALIGITRAHIPAGLGLIQAPLAGVVDDYANRY